jgi:hypothetical protein
MSAPGIGNSLLPELRNVSPVERARFVARQKAAGLTLDTIGHLLGVSAQRAGQLLKRYGHDPEIQSLRDIGSAIRLHRKGVAALAELVDLGLSCAREAATDPATSRKERAGIVAAAVGPAHRLVEGTERVLKRYGVGAEEKPPQQFDCGAFLDSVAVAIQKIESLPPEAQKAAKEALRSSILAQAPQPPAISVEATTVEAGPPEEAVPIP